MNDDLISRQAVLKQLRGCLTGGETEYQYVKLHIDSISSVTPQEPKTGHWIDAIKPIPLEERDAKLGITYKDAGYKCSECGAKHEEHRLSMIATKTNYCPNCGCRMVKPQESEE